MFIKRTSCVLILLMFYILPFVILPASCETEKPHADDRAALVNGAAITKDEFEGEVLAVQRNLLLLGKPLSCSQIGSIINEVIESMIRREVLYQESEKAGVKVNKALVRQELDALKKQFPSEADYKNELIRRNLSEEKLLDRMKKNLAVQKYVEKEIAEDLKITENEIITYYANNPDLFRQPFQVRLSHILVKSDSGWDEARRKDSRKKAQQIHQRLKNGEDFAAVARELSDGPTKTNGGDLGYVRKGQIENRLESVVFAMKTGETSEIVETDYGFHIFRVNDQRPESVLALEDVKEKIREFLRAEKARQEAFLQATKLREKALVKIFVSQ